MSLTVKICGLSDIEVLDAAIEAGADMVGFVLFARSPRFVTLHEAGKLADHARRRAEIVALTVDMDDVGLSRLVERIRPDWLQLHGAETPERVAAIRSRFPTKVMKAIGIRDRADLAAVSDHASAADRILLDAKPPKDSDRTGGHGVTFDWSILDEFRPATAWMLSGGLDPDNVAGAIRRTGAPGVDVSSGVETAPGRKDPGLIRAFVAAARAADAMAEKVAP